MPSVPPLLNDGAREARRMLQREELKLTTKLTKAHQARFRSFREQLKRWFLEFSVLKTMPDRREPVQVWDTSRAYRGRLDVAVTQAVDEMATDELTGDAQVFEDSLDDAFIIGNRQELWLMAMGGLPVTEFGQLPDQSFRTGAILAAGVAGLNWQSRLNRWSTWQRDTMDRMVRGSIVTESPFSETLNIATLIANQYDSRTSALAANEYHRAAMLGGYSAFRAAQAAGHECYEVWVTTGDRLVCPICEELNLTVTDLQPVTDSHPSCRCWKVPIPVDVKLTPQTFMDVLQELENL